MTIETTPALRSILVSGFSPTASQDLVRLFFESPRSQGGAVEKVHLTNESGQAVVVFARGSRNIASRFMLQKRARGKCRRDEPLDSYAGLLYLHLQAHNKTLMPANVYSVKRLVCFSTLTSDRGLL